MSKCVHLDGKTADGMEKVNAQAEIGRQPASQPRSIHQSDFAQLMIILQILNILSKFLALQRRRPRGTTAPVTTGDPQWL